MRTRTKQVHHWTEEEGKEELVLLHVWESVRVSEEARTQTQQQLAKLELNFCLLDLFDPLRQGVGETGLFYTYVHSIKFCGSIRKRMKTSNLS